MLASYELRFYNPYFEYLYSFNNIESLQFGRKKNDEGIAVVEMNGNIYNFNDFKKDSVMEIYRINPDTGKSELQGNTCWFLRKAEMQVDDECDEKVTLTFYDTMTILTRRVIAWVGVSEPNYPSIMLEPLDDIVTLIAHFNFGGGTGDPTYPNNPPGDLNANYTPGGEFQAFPGVESWQYAPYNKGVSNGVNDMVYRAYDIEIQVPSSQSTIAESNRFEFETCLKAMQDVAEISGLRGESLWFDIEYAPATTTTLHRFTFKTWVGVRGVDRTQGYNRMIIGPEFKNMANVNITKDWTQEATIVYVGGNGDNELKDMSSKAVAPEDYPFYPIEAYISTNIGEGTATHNSPEAINEAVLELAKRSRFQAMTGTIINKAPTQFGKHFFFGDLLIAKYKDFEEHVEVAEYSVLVDSDSESVEIPFSTLG